MMNDAFSHMLDPESAARIRELREGRVAAVAAAEAAGPVAMLDMALSLGEEELRALGAGEVETAGMYCELRARLLHNAGSGAASDERSQVAARLRAMGHLQNRLIAAGHELRAGMAARMSRSRQETRRLRSYRQCVGHALAAV